MIILLLFVIIVLLVLNSHSRTVVARRTNRLLRRVPCVTCGCPLLPAARACPNCHSSQPLRGWAGRRERLWRSAPGDRGHRAMRPEIHRSLVAANAAPPWWRRPLRWTDVWWVGPGVVVLFFPVVFTLITADPVPQSLPQPLPQHDTVWATATAGGGAASGVDRPTSQPRSPIDNCVAMLGAIDMANGHVGGFGAAIERLNWCKANSGSR
jgi:hypothetical protein